MVFSYNKLMTTLFMKYFFLAKDEVQHSRSTFVWRLVKELHQLWRRWRKTTFSRKQCRDQIVHNCQPLRNANCRNVGRKYKFIWQLNNALQMSNIVLNSGKESGILWLKYFYAMETTHGIWGLRFICRLVLNIILEFKINICVRASRNLRITDQN